MKHPALLLLLSCSLMACTRVPTGSFGTAGAGSAVPIIVNGNSNIQAERDLRRLKDVDASIRASLDRLDAALDPNSPPANLEKLVVGDDIDPAIVGNRSLYQQALIDQKMDEKNQQLIDDVRTGNLDNVDQNNATNPEQPNTRLQQQQSEIDAELDRKAEEAVTDVPDSNDNDVAEESPADDTLASANTDKDSNSL
ncbi:MAG: hypothetical protein ACO1RX_03820 [Candidatus Sericytochromatia bacterium]